MAGRIAGSKPYYELKWVDHEGNLIDDDNESFKFTSVTTVLDVISKPYLHGWYYAETLNGITDLMQKYGSKMPSDKDSVKSLLSTEKKGPFQKRNAAAKSGTDMHKQLEDLCAGKPVERTTRNGGLLDFWESLEHPVVATERRVLSFRYQVAGTLDLAIEGAPGSNGTKQATLLDLKSGNHVDWTAFLQLAAYRMMWNEMGLEPRATDTAIVHVPESGGYKILTAPEIDESAFLTALQLYRMMPPKYWRPDENDL